MLGKGVCDVCVRDIEVSVGEIQSRWATRSKFDEIRIWAAYEKWNKCAQRE